jgi:hypothetical protein
MLSVDARLPLYSTRLGNDGLGLLDRRNDDPGRGAGRGGVAVHLLGGKDRRGAGKKASLGLVVVGLVTGDGNFLVKDDIGGLLALAVLCLRLDSSRRIKTLDADQPPVQMVLSYRLAATLGDDPV